MRKIYHITSILLFTGFLWYSPSSLSQDRHTLSFGDNFRIYPSDVSQTEVFIVRSPVDERVLFASCNTLTFIPFFVSEGVYTSMDGGRSWTGSDSCKGEPLDFHGGDPGITIDKDGRFILTRLGRSPFTGLYSHYSDDNGLTWSEQVPVSTDDLERAAVATDALSGSLFYGRTYALWVKLAAPFPVMFAYTGNGAQSWSSPVAINDPSARSAGGDITVGPGGLIYACWAGVTSSSPFKEKQIGFASSADGGSTWDATENAFEVNGITGLLSDKQNIRVNGLPRIAVDMTDGARRGFIYIVTGQKDLPPAGNDPDIILHRSTDGGQTWSEGIRVNQDLLSNGKIQYFPAIHVDRFGAVNVIFYDDRNTTSDSTGVFLSRSVDGGDLWIEYEISDHSYRPTPIGGLGQGYQGDNIDLTSTDSTLFPVWMDNSSGNYQMWTTPIDFNSLSALEDFIPPGKEINLEQNFPNPFHSLTTIGFTLGASGHVLLEIFDPSGARVMTVSDEVMKKGRHEVVLDRSALQLPNGLYFYILSLGKYKTLRKMIII